MKASQKKTAQKPKAPVMKKAAPKKTVRKSARKTEIPAILLEGDRTPVAARPSGPGSRYALVAETSRPHIIPDTEPGELPDAYGTERLTLVSRDPHWLYAHWDLTKEQLQKYNRLSRDGHLVVRIFKAGAVAEPVNETYVHPESQNWFIYVEEGGARYNADLGYYDKRKRWKSISKSSSILTPPESLANDTSVDFATLPVNVPLDLVVDAVRQSVPGDVPLMTALNNLREGGYQNLPGPEYFTAALQAADPGKPAPWTPEQQKALAEVITMDEVRRVWIGSHEVTELVRKQLVKELASQAAADVSGAIGGARAISSLGMSSPHGGASLPGKGFWFNVNAELIIYGATEPDATVTIGERRIRLRSDGSFSYRFALPDGRYDLPVVATSAAGDDSREAGLYFSRDTQYHGEVETHPQDDALKTPRPENVA